MESEIQINEEISSAFSQAIATNDEKLYIKTWKKVSKIQDFDCDSILIEYDMDDDTFDMLTRFVTDFKRVYDESYKGFSYERLKRFETFFIRRGKLFEDIIKATDFFEQFFFIYSPSSYRLINKALDNLGSLKLDLMYFYGSGANPIFAYLTGYNVF